MSFLGKFVDRMHDTRSDHAEANAMAELAEAGRAFAELVSQNAIWVCYSPYGDVAQYIPTVMHKDKPVSRIDVSASPVLTTRSTGFDELVVRAVSSLRNPQYNPTARKLHEALKAHRTRRSLGAQLGAGVTRHSQDFFGQVRATVVPCDHLLSFVGMSPDQFYPDAVLEWTTEGLAAQLAENNES